MNRNTKERMTCEYRTRLVEPKGRRKPHRYTVKVTVGERVEYRCSGCWKVKP